MSSNREGDRRSVLATIGPLDLDLELSERDHDAAQAVAAGLRDAKAPNTHRAYETAWQAFQAWADAGGHRSLPATPQAVALYLGRLAADGKAMATILLLKMRQRLRPGGHQPERARPLRGPSLLLRPAP